jgi:hypothetical protein
MKNYVELIFSFIVLTTLSLFTIAAMRTLNEIDIQNTIVKPIIMEYK